MRGMLRAELEPEAVAVEEVFAEDSEKADAAEDQWCGFEERWRELFAVELDLSGPCTIRPGAWSSSKESIWSCVSSKTVVGVSGGAWTVSLRLNERVEEATERGPIEAEEERVDERDAERSGYET